MKHFMSMLSIILFCLIFWLVVWIVSCCSGCVTIEGTAPNGLHIKYTRFMADQKMDGLVIEPDGSMLIEGQASTLQGMTDALNAAINKIP